MATNAAGLFGGSSSLDALVEQVIAIERRPVIELEIQKSTLNVKKAIFSDLDSKLSKLQTTAKKLGDTIESTSIFNNKSVSTSNEGVVTGTAGSSAATGTHSLFVTQLAKQSTQVSNQFTSASNSLESSVGTGTKTFNVTVNGVSTEVSVDITAGDTDKTILANMATAINEAMDGVDDSVTANALDDTSTTSKLTISSNNTGVEYKVSLSDVSGTLISATGIGGTSEATDTTGGYIYSDSLLDAKFTLNGVNLTRSSNTVTDALTGVTLSLKATQDTGDGNVTLTIGPDVGAIRTELDTFISDYNDVIKYMNLKTTSSSGVRGELAGDFTFRNLLVQMRTFTASGVTGVTDSSKDRLAFLGVTTADDGTISVTDTSKLEDAIKDGSLAEIFNTPTTGLGDQFDNLIEGFVVTGGIISDHKSIIDTRMKSIDRQIATLSERVDKKAQQFREQFSAVQESLILLQGQASAFNLFSNSFG